MFVYSIIFKQKYFYIIKIFCFQCQNKTWFAIPLPLTDDDINNKNFYWRLSFSCQEKEILTKYGRIKPVIRQMKVV